MEKIGYQNILSFFKKEKPPADPTQSQAASQVSDGYGGQVQQSPAQAQPQAASSQLKAAADILLKKNDPAKLEKLWQHSEVMNYCGPGVIDRNGLLFTRGDTNTSNIFICVDSNTGDRKWQLTSPEGAMTGFPILDDSDNLLQGFSDGTLKMLDKGSGSDVKTITFDKGDVRPFRGNDGTLYVENNSRLYTIDTASGSRKFYADFSGKGCWPVVGQNGMVVVVSGEHTVTAIDPAKAQVKWSVNPPGLVRCPVNIGPDGTVYAPSTDKMLVALDPDTGKEKWNFKTGSFCMTPPAIDKEGTVYLGSCDHKVYAIDPASGREIWQHDVTGEVRANPVLGPGGLLGVASDRNVLYGLDRANGNEVFRQPADSYMHFPPLFGRDNTVFISANNATLYGYKGSFTTAEARMDMMAGGDDTSGSMEIDDNYITIDDVRIKVQKDQVMAFLSSLPPGSM